MLSHEEKHKILADKITKDPKNRLGINGWSMMVREGFWIPRKLDLLYTELMNFALKGQIANILIEAPPRHGKSEHWSENFISYFLANYPNDKAMSVAYNIELARDFGKVVKGFFESYGDLSPHRPYPVIKDGGVDRWRIDRPYNGSMLLAGTNGAMLGFGAGLGVVDDPIKNIKEAESSRMQEVLYDWYNATFKSRLERRSNGLPPIQVIVGQRLSLNDLHGIILKKNKGKVISYVNAIEYLRQGNSFPEDIWLRVSIPAICYDPENDPLGRKKGEVLWEEQRDYDWLMNEKRESGSYLFNAIYQQQPEERQGGHFKRYMFKKYVEWDRLKHYLRKLPWVRMWDFASSGESGDSCANMLGTYDGKYIYFLEMFEQKFEADELVTYFIDTLKRDGENVYQYFEDEPGSEGKILLETMIRLPEVEPYADRLDLWEPVGSKSIRAFNLKRMGEQRRIVLLKDWWNDLYISRAVAFTGKKTAESKGKMDVIDCSTALANLFDDDDVPIQIA